MARKRHTAEEIIGHLRTVDIDLGKGSAVPEACRKLGITELKYLVESGRLDRYAVRGPAAPDDARTSPPCI